jgi:4-amino-4-deoxy-L-arabinose transferase-like glycosyltransferase
MESNDPSRVIPRARLPIAALTLGLAAAVWAWTRAAAGAQAGLIALALTAFHPSLLAHGHLATTDLPAALAMVLASWALWAWCRRPSSSRAAVVGLALGGAVATRLTGWLLVPAFLLILAWRWRRNGGAGSSAADSGSRSRVGLLLAIVLLPPAVVWAAYGFHRAPWPGASVLQDVSPRLGVAGRVVAGAHRARLLPEAYLEGARYQIEHTRQGHPAYLLGERSRTGWPQYFLVAFLVKNTPGFLLAVAVAGFGCWMRGSARFRIAADCVLPAAFLFAAVSLGRIQIGERYLLPVYPYLIVLVASCLARLGEGLAGRLLVGLVLVLHLGPALAAAGPGYLTYFNLLAGGPAGGERVLLDSNLDWGQDLPRLATWMRRHHVARVQLAYDGVDDPDRFGIEHEDLPGNHLHPGRPAAEPFHGVVAVSPNLLFGLSPPVRDTYESLRGRIPDDRAGVFHVYVLDGRDAPR